MKGESPPMIIPVVVLYAAIVVLTWKALDQEDKTGIDQGSIIRSQKCHEGNLKKNSPFQP